MGKVIVTNISPQVTVTPQVTTVRVSQESRDAMYLRGRLIGDLSAIEDGQVVAWSADDQAFVASDPATGGVTSVDMSVPAGIFALTGNPIISAGVLALTLLAQPANRVWAGPTSGVDAQPTFRALVANDIPDLSGTYATKSYADAGDATVAALIPTNTNELTNGAGFVTPSSVATFTNKSGNISQWTNDSGYLTSVTNITGNAGTATALQTARAINGVSFDGTAAITVAAAAGTLTGSSLASGVTASSLTSFGASPALATPAITGPATITEAVGSSALTIAGATQTASFPALNITQTWNNAGVTFTGLKFNVTNTASASGSLLLDLQLGGTSVTSVSCAGLVRTDLISGTIGFQIATSTALTAFGLTTRSDGAVQWTSSANGTSGTIDLSLVRDAAGVLAQRNSTNAQAFRLYKTYTDASNYERLTFGFSSNVPYIQPEVAGTGTKRAFHVKDAAGNIWLQLPPDAAQTYGMQLGGAVTNTPKSVGRVILGANTGTAFGSGTHIVVNISEPSAQATTSTLTFIPLQIAPTINWSAATPGAGSYEALKISVTETALPTGTNYLIRASAGSSGTTDRFTVTNAGVVTATRITLGSLGVYLNDSGGGTANLGGASGIFQLSTSSGCGGIFGSTVSNSGTHFIRFMHANAAVSAAIEKPADNILEQRNGTNAQTFRVYNTYTDASNYERLGIIWSTNVAVIQPEKAGTGSNRALQVKGPLGQNFQLGTNNDGQLYFSPVVGSAANATGTIYFDGGAQSASNSPNVLVRVSANVNPTSTSTQAFTALYITPTINYSNGTPGAGSYEALKVAVTETALPTGQSYLARLAAGASGTTDIWRMTNRGVQIQASVAADPTTTIVATSDFAIYRKNSKFVIAYNNGGTMTYLTIPLDAATATWTQSTTAP